MLKTEGDVIDCVWMCVEKRDCVKNKMEMRSCRVKTRKEEKDISFFLDRCLRISFEILSVCFWFEFIEFDLFLYFLE